MYRWRRGGGEAGKAIALFHLQSLQVPACPSGRPSACVCECVQVSVSCSDDIALLWSAATWGPGQPTHGHKAASAAAVAAVAQVAQVAAEAGVATCLSM